MGASVGEQRNQLPLRRSWHESRMKHVQDSCCLGTPAPKATETKGCSHQDFFGFMSRYPCSDDLKLALCSGPGLQITQHFQFFNARSLNL